MNRHSHNMPAAGISQVLSQISAKKIFLRRRGGGVGRAQTWDRVHVSRGMLLPLQPGDPTKLPAAILRGAPFGLSSPTREECSSLSLKYCYPLPAGFPGGHLRHSGMRASEDGASTAPPCYAACNAPASRRKWRIASALHVSPRHSYGRRGVQAAAVPPVNA